MEWNGSECEATYLSCRKRSRWHFRDPIFKYFLLGQHAPRLLQVWGVFGSLTFILLRAPSKSHATLPTTCILNSVDYEINAQGWKKTLGLEGDGGRGGVHFKLLLPGMGVQLSDVILFLGRGGKFWCTTLLTPRLGRNERSAPFKILLQHPHRYFCNAAWNNIKRKTRVKRSEEQKLELYEPLQLTSFTSSLQYPLIPHRADEGPLICFPLAQENEQIESYLWSCKTQLSGKICTSFKEESFRHVNPLKDEI